MTPDFYARLAAAPMLVVDATERAASAAIVRRLLDRMRGAVHANVAAFVVALRRTLVAQVLRELAVGR